jgi:hypothetical protein
MKIYVFILMIISSTYSYSQVDWSGGIKANNPNWTNSNLTFKKGAVITITASGGWRSGSENYPYSGHSGGHTDGRSVDSKVPVMTLLVHISDGPYSHKSNFNHYEEVQYTFKTDKGRVKFICNDDMNTPRHYLDNSGAVVATIVEH